MQTTLQNKENNRKQVLSLVFLICSIVIGFFFTLDQGYSYIEKKDTLDATKKEIIEKKALADGRIERLLEGKKPRKVLLSLDPSTSSLQEPCVHN